MLGGATHACMHAWECHGQRRPPAWAPASVDSPKALAWLNSDIDTRRDYVLSACNVVLLPQGKASTRVFNPMRCGSS